MFNGKMKALTFSYDDGVTQDIKLIELFDKYGMKATFNLNSGFFGQKNELIRDGVTVSHNKVNSEDVKYIYANHEVAVHTVTHPVLKTLSEQEVISEVEEDRIILSELVGYEVVGMAYPFGTTSFTKRDVNLIENHTGIKYARNTTSNFRFDVQNGLLDFEPTVYHHQEMDKMFELGEQFLNLKPEVPQIFYVWGHAYEFDINDGWEKFENFLQMMAGKDDICYCTNKEAILKSYK